MATLSPYVVRQGDYLTRIAAMHGLGAHAVWDHPANAELRAARTSPEMLAPGDVLQLPIDDTPRSEPAFHSATTNRYRARVPRVALRVQLCADGEPLAGVRCTIDGLKPTEYTTDATGDLSFRAPIHVERVTIRVPSHGMAFDVLVGHLDPPDHHSGVRHRLTNAGLLPPSATSDSEERRDAEVYAGLERFQAAQGLAVTGEADEATRAALRAVNRS